MVDYWEIDWISTLRQSHKINLIPPFNKEATPVYDSVIAGSLMNEDIELHVHGVIKYFVRGESLRLRLFLSAQIFFVYFVKRLQLYDNIVTR